MTMLTNTISAAKNGLDSAKDSTKSALDAAKEGATSAKESTLQTYARVLATVVKGVTATGGIITMLRGLDRDDGLAWLGLSRKRSPLLTLGILGAGAVAGAGIALWFAPTTGANLRAAIIERLGGVVKKAEDKAEEIASSGNGAVAAVKEAAAQVNTATS